MVTEPYSEMNVYCNQYIKDLTEDEHRYLKDNNVSFLTKEEIAWTKLGNGKIGYLLNFNNTYVSMRAIRITPEQKRKIND